MIWAILAFLGVPLWLCAVGIAAVVFRNRGLRKRHGDIPVRILRPGKTRWMRGHAIWVSNVLVWRGSPAAWNEDLWHTASATVRDPDPDERHGLRGLGDTPVVAALTTDDGRRVRLAAAPEHRTALMGPFAAGAPRP
jgi:hypothetical protein